MLAVLLGSQFVVNFIGMGLVLFGVALVIVTLSFWRAARIDPEALAPLEVMQDRKFNRADSQMRIELLNKFRPAGAEPIENMTAPSVLSREPDSEPEKEVLDSFSHDDDAFDIIENPNVVPDLIDPLIHYQHENGGH
ncbi:MAG: hypothetical protein EXQ63_01300 [Ilumatobacteraceae bacterium]|nr:hypothetical protein [Ilumatobacteraceae bacterium]